jgi:hypothetical protein
MLTPLDDTLWHQLPTTFDHVGTSDPRFFDRYWFACYAPDRHAGLQLTMGAYRNMNVLDGGAAVITGGRQVNVRVSRSLERCAEPRCGVLKVEPVVPLRELSLTIEEGPHPLRGEIAWRGIAPPYEEHPHFERQRGRVAQEYLRFSQIGVADGWVEVDGRREEVKEWWACRDHSWGVRRGMGVREPVTGPKGSLSQKGHVQAFLYFSTQELCGTVHLLRRGDDEPYTTGAVAKRGSGHLREIRTVALNVDFYPGTRRFRRARLDVTLSDGTPLRIDSEAAGPSFAMQGLGYSGGYDDRGGPGAWRGDSYLETDTWDVSAPSIVVLADGNTEEPWHRIQPVRVTAETADGRSTGTGSMTLTVSGKLPQYLQR